MPSVARRFEQPLNNNRLDCGSAPPLQVDMSAQRQWSCEGGTSLRDSSDSKCHSVYDSGCMDSGFLSGTNLSSENFVSEEIKSRNFSDTELDSPTKSVDDDCKSYARLDSGVDVGLNEQFSSLSLKSINDLNEPTSKTQDVTSRLTNIIVPTSHSTTVPSKPAPWEKYFQYNSYGDTPLHEAVIAGFVEAVSALIRIAPVPDLLDIRNDMGQTALHVAVLTRQWMVVRQLVIGGASPAVRDRHGNTAVHLTSQVGDVESFKALVTPVSQQEVVRAGLQGRPVPPSAASARACMEQFNYDGLMCVHLAAEGSHVDMLRNLVICGADINAREAKSGRTVLHLAIEYRLTAVRKFLLEEVLGSLQLDAVTYAGLTAYQLAACVDPSLADRLLNAGARRRAVPDDSSDEEDQDDEELEEMYPNYPSKYFQELKFNGGPINASA